MKIIDCPLFLLAYNCEVYSVRWSLIQVNKGYFLACSCVLFTAFVWHVEPYIIHSVLISHESFLSINLVGVFICFL